MTTGKDNYVEVKAPFLYWQYLIFFSTGLLLAAVIGFLVRNHTAKQNFWAFLIFSLLCLCAYYLTVYLTKSQTTISLANGLLTIKQTANKINKENLITIETHHVRGFEVAHLANGYPNLVIYLNNGRYHRLPIYKISDGAAIKALLANEIKELTSKNNPNFKSYGSAFLFALRQVFICIALILSIIYGITYNQCSYEDLKLWNIPLFLAIILTCWIFIVSIPAWRKRFRYYGFSPFGYLAFLLITVIAFIPASFMIKELKKEPVHVSTLNEILAYPKNDIFFVEHTNYAPQHLFYRSFVKGGGRSMKFRVDHVFVTPITSPTQKEPIQVVNFWLAKDYVQSIRKTMDSTLKEKVYRNFAIQSQRQFTSDLKKKPGFYRVIYHSSTNKGNRQAYEVAQSSGMTNSTTVILEPYWQTLSSYSANLRTKIIWLAIAIIAFNVLGAAIIAGQR